MLFLRITIHFLAHPTIATPCGPATSAAGATSARTLWVRAVVATAKNAPLERAPVDGCEGSDRDMAVGQNLVPLVNIKIAGKWMFIPLKMVLIGIDPYPYIVINRGLIN